MKIRLKKVLILSGAGVVAVLVIVIIWLVVWLNWQPVNLENRALVILSESNGYVTDQSVKFYYDYKKVADFFLTKFLGVEKTELEDNGILQVFDTLIDRLTAEITKKFAKGYGKVVVLTDEAATLDSFAETLKQLDREGYTIDIVVYLHGYNNLFYFRSKMVTGDALLEALGKLNLGFVYQANCYGKSNLGMWLKAGAKAVSGPEGLNAMSDISPNLVIRTMAWGKPFAETVLRSYGFEAGFWRMVKVFASKIFWTSKSFLETSRPFVAGDLNYRIEKKF